MTLSFSRLALGLAAALAAGSVSAATVVIVIDPLEGPTEGLNDPTPRLPTPGNSGVTLGQARLNVLQAAANQWGAILTSPVPIQVQAKFDPQTCGAGGTVLGSAGAREIFADFPNAPFANTWYSAALSNALAGSDLNPALPDITSTYNVSLDTGCSPGTIGWSYTTDTALEPFAANQIPLLPVVFHEMGHGFGFQTYTNRTTGAFLNGRPDIWARFLFDVPSRLRWLDMTDAQRVASAISDANLVWNGPNANADVIQFLGARPSVLGNTPVTAPVEANPATFGAVVPPAGFTDDVVAAIDANDVTGPSTTDGCTALTNAVEVSGKIALIDRGTCTFVVKAQNAQAAGATGLIIANNVACGAPGMGGADPAITIPAYGITQAAGNNIRSQLAQPGTVNVTLGFDTNSLAGVSGQSLRMYAPCALVAGSSVSHFDVSAFPNLLMEPAINNNLFNSVDLTLSLFRDIGWQDVGPTYQYILSDGFENQ